MQNQAQIGQYSNSTWSNVNSPQVPHNLTLQNTVSYLKNKICIKFILKLFICT